MKIFPSRDTRVSANDRNWDASPTAGGDWAGAGNRRPSSAGIVLFVLGRDRGFGLCDPWFHISQFDRQRIQRCRASTGDAASSSPRIPSRGDDAKPRHVSAQRVDQHGSLSHQQIANPLRHRHRPVLGSLTGTAAHAGPGHRSQIALRRPRSSCLAWPRV